MLKIESNHGKVKVIADGSKDEIFADLMCGIHGVLEAVKNADEKSFEDIFEVMSESFTDGSFRATFTDEDNSASGISIQLAPFLEEYFGKENLEDLDNE